MNDRAAITELKERYKSTILDNGGYSELRIGIIYGPLIEPRYAVVFKSGTYFDFGKNTSGIIPARQSIQIHSLTITKTPDSVTVTDKQGNEINGKEFIDLEGRL